MEEIKMNTKPWIVEEIGKLQELNESRVDRTGKQDRTRLAQL